MYVTARCSSLITHINEPHHFSQLTLSLVGKLGATASFAILFVYTAEMFPTEIRSTAVGSSSTCGRIGGILAPQVDFYLPYI
jgi:OCT family organic cation transporter-like MFS transporter 4/5